ncbi:hypothetical protein PBT90_17120 [Algoriphagus halophytocola]|uniref:Uncharacterized protein n=1 Tax=Algoriphagus halophytocola TaxID=2991499 RepID=A0ABY6MFN4_9BACT|nr:MULTISPECIES: hypothetical protein [unclassified Algoriphagus]UZD21247.1 hypothetical protein OM944_11255 [Algoriphagus sp. TR-M5]WBL42458.1 hypothetical protein PBT90_17120 [Algoriphagus sp. TR-M9]
MKNLLFLLSCSILFISCDKLEEPDILGSYAHTPEDCIPGDNPEFSCGRFITLSAGGVADVLYGGDIISRTTYKLKGDKIKIENNDQFGVELTFKKLDDGTLREESDKSIWFPIEFD